MPGALHGLRVLDLTNHLSGPYCTMMLGDHGADVIKIERPGVGDDARTMPPFVEGEGAPFMTWNRNKRSVELNLKDQSDVARFLQLVDGADILVENFKPGTMERLGLGYELLKQRNPRLIYGAISGFGRNGPYRNKGGFDLMTQAMSGLMCINGPTDGPPFRLPIAISDVAAGMFLAFGIVTALEARHRTGRGQMVDTSLIEAATSFCVYESAHYFARNERPPRIGQAHRGASPYQVFQTTDGHIIIGAASQGFWERFCDLIEAPELKDDPRFRDNGARVANNDALVALLQDIISRQSSKHWLDLMDANGIPGCPVLECDEMFADPQMKARDMIVAPVHPKAGAFAALGIPVKLSDTPGDVRRAAPVLGEHTGEVLSENE